MREEVVMVWGGVDVQGPGFRVQGVWLSGSEVTTSQKYAAFPRRARSEGSHTLSSLNLGLKDPSRTCIEKKKQRKRNCCSWHPKLRTRNSLFN